MYDADIKRVIFPCALIIFAAVVACTLVQMFREENSGYDCIRMNIDGMQCIYVEDLGLSCDWYGGK